MTRRKRSGVGFAALAAVTIGAFVMTGRYGRAEDPGRVPKRRGQSRQGAVEATPPETARESAAGRHASRGGVAEALVSSDAAAGAGDVGRPGRLRRPGAGRADGADAAAARTPGRAAGVHRAVRGSPARGQAGRRPGPGPLRAQPQPGGAGGAGGGPSVGSSGRRPGARRGDGASRGDRGSAAERRDTAARRGPRGAAGHPRHALRPGTGSRVDPADDRQRAGRHGRARWPGGRPWPRRSRRSPPG